MKNKIFANIRILLFTIIFTLCLVPSGTRCYAYTVDEVQQLIDGIVAYKLNESGSGSVQGWINGPLTVGAGVSSEWYVIGLSQNGYSNFSSYEASLSAYLDSHNVSSATTRLKYALALCAAGSSNRYMADVLDTSIGQQGIMSYIYGLHVLNNGYTCSSFSTQSVVDTLVSLQYADGGWALYGGNGDIDVTAMTIQALAPYYLSNGSVRSAIDRGVEFLSQKQESDGGYQSFGTPNPESAAQVLVALSALGIDCENDARFVKNGNTLIAGIAKYRLADGSFSHTQGGGSNETATFQAFYSLISYQRVKSGKGPLHVFDNRRPVSAGTRTSTDNGGQSSQSNGSQNQGQVQGQSGGTQNQNSAGTGGNGNVQTGTTQGNAAHTSDIQGNAAGSDMTAGPGSAALSDVSGGSVSGEAVSGEAVSGEAVSGEAISGAAASGEAVTGEAVSKTSVSGMSAVSSKDGRTNVSENETLQASKHQKGFYKPWAILAIVGSGAVVSAVLFFLKKRNYKNYIAVGIAVVLGSVIVLATDISSKKDYYTGTKEQKEHAIGTVTLTIRCDTIVGKDDSKYVPKDGMILDTTEFDIEEGDTVFSVLTEAAKTYKIQIENTGSSGNAHGLVYISGINYIYEMDYGDLSGWVYHVNGITPSRNCGEYVLKDGDKIEWLYTCELGHDLNEIYEDDVSQAGVNAK